MKFLPLAGLFLVLSVGKTTMIHAQACTAFERELQEYFVAYQPNELLNIHQIETVRNQCPQPTEKLELLYYYFRAMNARNATGQSAFQAYQGATFFYDQCARFFPYLVDAPAYEDQFVETFFARAHELEQWLQKEARRLRVTRENRYYGELAGEGEWQRSHVPDPNDPYAENTRGQAPRIIDFQRKYYQRDQYVDQLFSEGTRGAQGGYRDGTTPSVGFVGDLNFFDYLEWKGNYQEPAAVPEPATIPLDAYNWGVPRTQGDWESEFPADGPATYRSEGTYDYGSYRNGTFRTQTQPAGTTPVVSAASPTAWIDRLNQGEVDFWLLTALREGVPVYGNLSAQQVIGTLAFGQAVAQNKLDKSVKSGTQTYLPVVTQTGRQGYVDFTELSRDGQLAVITRQTSAYETFSEEEQQNAVLLQPGEMVVIDGANNSWMRLIGPNGEKRGWVFGFDHLSTDPLDIAIGREIILARLETNPNRRRQRLNNLRSLPGFGNSPLAPLTNQ
ncbi:MAG: hypothetical protein AAF399_15385 [Bacteroidota bacterium]